QVIDVEAAAVVRELLGADIVRRLRHGAHLEATFLAAHRRVEGADAGPARERRLRIPRPFPLGHRRSHQEPGPEQHDSTSPTRHEGALYHTRGTRRPEKSRSEEHTSELQSRFELVCRLLLEK